jgi:AcrR family transcriptional regulator
VIDSGDGLHSYGHFPTWEALLDAAVQRAVGRVMAALESTHPNQGPPAQALDRMLAAAWQHLAHYQAMAEAVSELLSPEASPARTRRRIRPSGRPR